MRNLKKEIGTLFFLVYSIFLKASDKPNVILIMADDMGYAGIASFGGIGLKTQNLDRLATEGVVCKNFHTNAPVCSPTRVSIMLGSYQQRAGLNSIYSGTDPMHGLDPQVYPAFVKELKNAGYRTGIFGKWHLGLDDKYNPLNQGFDEFVGFRIGNIDMVSHRNRLNEIDWWHNTEIVEEEGYATHLYNQYAVDFIRESKDQPFFLYVPHGAIHTPIQAPGDAPVRDGVNPPIYDNARDMAEAEYQRRYRAMVKSIDDGLKMIFDELEKQGILDNTLIIFTSDNGAEATAAQKYFGANGFFNGYKNTLYEGGIRVPAIFYYPKQMKHYNNNEMMLTMDLMPTILEFCGIENNRDVDGVSLLPSLIEREPMPKRDVFWANMGSIAMQRGDWKLIWQTVRGREHDGEEKVELFNMMIDPKEQHDLKDSYPEKTEEMKEAVMDWWNEVTRGTGLEGTSALRTPVFGH